MSLNHARCAICYSALFDARLGARGALSKGAQNSHHPIQARLEVRFKREAPSAKCEGHIRPPECAIVQEDNFISR